MSWCQTCGCDAAEHVQTVVGVRCHARKVDHGEVLDALNTYTPANTTRCFCDEWVPSQETTTMTTEKDAVGRTGPRRDAQPEQAEIDFHMRGPQEQELIALRAEVAGLKDERDESHIYWRELVATHRCKECGAKWIDCGFVFGADHDGWSLASRECGPCCDNVAMGEQIEAVGVFAEFARLRRERDDAAGLLAVAREVAGEEGERADKAEAEVARLRRELAEERTTINAIMATVCRDCAPMVAAVAGPDPMSDAALAQLKWNEAVTRACEQYDREIDDLCKAVGARDDADTHEEALGFIEQHVTALRTRAETAEADLVTTMRVARAFFNSMSAALRRHDEPELDMRLVDELNEIIERRSRAALAQVDELNEILERRSRAALRIVDELNEIIERRSRAALAQPETLAVEITDNPAVDAALAKHLARPASEWIDGRLADQYIRHGIMDESELKRDIVTGDAQVLDRPEQPAPPACASDPGPPEEEPADAE